MCHLPKLQTLLTDKRYSSSTNSVKLQRGKRSTLHNTNPELYNAKYTSCRPASTRTATFGPAPAATYAQGNYQGIEKVLKAVGIDPKRGLPFAGEHPWSTFTPEAVATICTKLGEGEKIYFATL